ncbi:hypothetical protein D3C73_1278610 [compost metagenome]
MGGENSHLGRILVHLPAPIPIWQQTRIQPTIPLILEIYLLIAFPNKKNAADIWIAVQHGFQKRVDRYVVDLLQLVDVISLIQAGALHKAFIPASIHNFGHFIVLVESRIQIIAHVQNHLLQIGSSIPLHVPGKGIHRK